MRNKFFKRLRDDIKENYIIYIVYIVILLVSVIPLNYYIYSPGGLVDLTDRIKVENSYKQEGSFNLTYVTTRHATLMTYGLSYLFKNWDLDKIENRQIDDESYDDIETREGITLKETSYDAIIAAFTEAGKEYKIKRTDVTVIHTFDYADTNIEVGDIVKKVDNKEIKDVEDISEILSNKNINDKIKIIVQRNNKNIERYAIVKEKDNRKVIGILLSLIKDVETNPKVEYVFKRNEKGSSRGLMSALDIYNKITEEDLTKGNIISGTGTIDEKGKVYAIDGVKYKMIGAVKSKSKVFIVPSDNYDEAVKIKKENNFNIDVIKVDTLHEAVEALKNR